jgi:hypothetical protein
MNIDHGVRNSIYRTVRAAALRARLTVRSMTFTVTPSISYTYVYIHVSHVYKLAYTLHRTINLLSLSALSSHI